MKYVYVPIYARNVWFGQYAEAKINQLLDRAANNNVKKWIKSNLRNWLINKAPLDEVRKVDLAREDAPNWVKDKYRKEDIYLVQQKDVNNIEKLHIDHIIDYLNTLDHNVSNMSVEEVIRQVHIWDDKLAFNMKNQQDSEEDDISIVKELSNGYKWVLVNGEKSLKREGDLMGHCVGSYAKQVRQGKTRIYSLRDKNNNPHVTIEYEVPMKAILQIKGKQNLPPLEKYRPMITKLINSLDDVDIIDSEDLLKIGYFFDVNKEFIPINSKKNVHLHDLYIDENTQIVTLPNMEIDRSFTYSGTEELQCGNISATDIVIDDSVIKECGDLTATRKITIRDCTIKDIGKLTGKLISLVESGGSLSVECDKLTVYSSTYELHDSKIGILTSSNSEIHLFDNVEIKEFKLDESSAITNLGKNNHIPGLDLVDYPIKNIPSGFVCDTLVLNVNNLPKIQGKPKVNTLVLGINTSVVKNIFSGLEKYLKGFSYKRLEAYGQLEDVIEDKFPNLKLSKIHYSA